MNTRSKKKGLKKKEDKKRGREPYILNLPPFFPLRAHTYIHMVFHVQTIGFFAEYRSLL